MEDLMLEEESHGVSVITEKRWGCSLIPDKTNMLFHMLESAEKPSLYSYLLLVLAYFPGWCFHSIRYQNVDHYLVLAKGENTTNKVQVK